MTLCARIKKPEKCEGHLDAPGDKSISHRALILASLSETPVELQRLAPGDDVKRTAQCLSDVGAVIHWQENGVLVRRGDWRSPRHPLECGNSGTSMRLLAGFLSGLQLDFTLQGDASLSRRPMARICEPLTKMGAHISAREGQWPPIHFTSGLEPLHGERHALSLSSAQVKSCLLLAGLHATSDTFIREPQDSRDHSERMLQALSAPLKRLADGTWHLQPLSQPLQFPDRIEIPGDPSSAAFFVAAALLHPQGNAEIHQVSTNPSRLGFMKVLQRMGADLHPHTTHHTLGEPVGRMVARGGQPLLATRVEPSEVPEIIDEIPILGVLMTQAHGRSEVHGARELRQKESDRIARLVQNLRKMGAKIDEWDDGFAVEGPIPLKGARVEAFGDHRIAMSLSIAGLVAEGETELHGVEWVNISFPEFYTQLKQWTGDAVRIEPLEVPHA